MLSVFINIGKGPLEPIHVKNMKPGPTLTPFGNFQLIDLTVINRIDYLNIKAKFLYEQHSKLFTDNGVASAPIFTIYKGDLESIVHMLRSLIDRIITSVLIMDRTVTENKYPSNQNLIDSIGKLLNIANKNESEVILSMLEKDEITYLKNLNSMSNATKHQIYHDNHNLLGKDEPVLNIFHLKNGVETQYSYTLFNLLKLSEPIINKLRDKYGELGKTLLDMERKGHI